ncbi:MAG: response regulator [Clostridia bacterium]|nr:response regulator [Clostridia bacterium]
MADGSKERATLNEEMLIPAIRWMAEQIPGGFFVYLADASGKLIYVNDVCIRMFGCNSEAEFRELTGFTFQGLVHPDDYQRIQASIEEQIANPDNQSLDYVEYRIVRKDGSVRWVDDYGHFTHLPGYGDVYYVFISDITEKHNASAESNRRAQVYEGMREQLNMLADESLTVFRTNITTGVIEEARGRDLYDTDYPGGSIAKSAAIRAKSFLVPGDAERYSDTFRLEKLVDRYYKGEGPAVFVGYCRRQSGRQCFVKFSGSAAIDPLTGDVIAFGVETEYNTEKVTEVLNQRVLAQQYDMVSYIVGDHYGVVIGDPANIKRGGIFPKKRDGIYSEYIRDQVLPAASSSYDKAELEKALSAETIIEKLKHQDTYTVDVTGEEEGEVYFKRFTYYLVDRDAQFYLLLKSDITDVLREERERNQALGDALQSAEQANAAKTAFLSNMSHEIRTPMNAIIGLDSIALQLPDLSPQVREYLEKIDGSARHLLSLINDILDMSRIESGRVTLRNEDFSFSAMLEQINTLVQTQCRDKGLQFECRILGQVSDRYIGDAMKLKQVVVNILSNAIKFTDAPGSVSFTVEQTVRYEDNATLRFVISDTGIGMDEAFLPRIFEAFSQEDSSRSSKYGSTGLGMTITKNIVEMMNGSISVTSQKGVGTTFTVTVTLRNSEAKEGRGDFALPGEMKVLVIDDDPIACEHARIVLEEIGIAADTCLDGQEALRLIELRHAKHEPYHLVLVDWRMPGQDGLEVTREIRARYNHETMVIILTAYNWDDIVDEARNAGVDGFMAKPLFASNVLMEYESVAKKKSGQAAAARRAELKGRRILLAEDVMINAEIMKQVLAMREMTVDHAENGRQALEMFAASPIGHYDAVLMDVRMPVMDGLQATAAIRALDRADAGRVPIIALTANAFDEDVQQSLQAGMTAHLSKPVEPEHLYETLTSLIF